MSTRVLAVLAGIGSALLVVLLLSPKGCTDSLPPLCYSVLGYSVPGGSWWIAVALATGLLAAWAVASVVRRSRKS